jgi:hypothetical protein
MPKHLGKRYTQGTAVQMFNREVLNVLDAVQKIIYHKH